MSLIQSLLSRAFPFMAITGLLLAGWGLIVTPDEIKGDSQWTLWGARSAYVDESNSPDLMSQPTFQSAGQSAWQTAWR